MKNKLFSILIVLSMLLPNVAVAYADTEFEGEGTSESPYFISTAEDLIKLATLTNTVATAADYADKYYQLTADIDMTGVSYKPISYAKEMYKPEVAAFSGTLDGNNHIIKNISFANIAQYGSTYGIIGFISANGVVKNLGVENMTVNGGAANRLCIGGIAGSLGAPVTIENCYVRGMSVTTTSTDATYVGGIAGRTIGNEGIIKNCYATSLDFTNVKYANLKAGILGSSGNVNYKAENCYSTYSRLQGYTSATNSYMGTINCYGMVSVENLTADMLGSAFKKNPTVKNDGLPVLEWESTEGYELREEEKEVEDPYFKGKGTEEEPFEIDSAEKLCQLSTLSNDANNAKYASKFYILTADIDMTGISYKPISWATSMYTVQGAAFTGTLDGNKHIIKNISFTNLATYGSTYGIIGFISANGVVKNLGVENMTVNGGAANRLCIGGIAGSLGSPVTIENCYVRGMSVTTTSTDATYVGGIAGRTIGNEGIIKNCYSTGLDFTKVTRAGLKAGILGSSGNVNYKAENCYTTDAQVQGNTAATNSYMETINCYGVSAKVADLGLGFIADSDSINGGNPILTWEYEKKNPTAEKKNVSINKIGNGTVEFVNAGSEITSSVNAYSAQDLAFTLASDDGYVITSVSYNRTILKANNGKYSFNVADGGELKVVFSQIVDSDAEFYVSLSGADINDGKTPETPFETVEMALVAAKAFRGTKVINIEEGAYNIEETILLDADDSGIVLRAYNNGEVLLNGGKKIEKAWFNPTAENENILVADLKANGITEYGRIKSVGYGVYADSSDKNASPVFTIDGEYQVPARYPNSGYIKTGDIVTGAENTENLSFKTSDSHVSDWVGEKDAWIFGYFKNDWADASLPVTVGEDGTITANGKSAYGAASGSRFYIFNALSELDYEGEYYIDRVEGKMYIYKPSNWDSVENMVFSAGDNSIIEINSAENIALEGLTIENTNASGIIAKNAEGLSVRNCIFKNIGQVAMSITGSDNVTVEGNDIENIGYAGIIYTHAGDRQTLTSCNSEIKNNTIKRTGIQRTAGAYAIDISNTVGVKVSGNDISDLPHGAILYMTSNDTIIEYNKIYNVIKDTSDAGAIYSGRDWTTRGNIIRYNYIHDITDIKNVNNASAVYLDDMHSSTEVYQNVIYNVPQAILLGGGRNNSFTNNLIIDCNTWIEADQRGTRTNLDYMKHMLSQVPYTSAAWSKYDNLADILDDGPEYAKYNIIKDNVVYNSKGNTTSWFLDLFNMNTNNMVIECKVVSDTGFFAGYSEKEFALSENAKNINNSAYTCVKNIPFGKLGFKVPGVFEVENVEIKEEGSNLVASVKMINNTSEEFSTKLIIAQYNGNRLEMCSVKPVPVDKNAGVIEDSLTVAKDGDTTSFKVFLWDTNMKPLW